MKLTKLKQYLTTPNRCFVPKCRARCCANAPLPEDFLPKHQDKIQRQIFGGFNMGQNDPRDTYNSIIYSTRPIIFIGYDTNGKQIATISQEMIEELNIKSMEDVYNLLNEYEARKIYNYCPFIQRDARCSVYSERPPICREFGTEPGKINECPDKASRLDVYKFSVKLIYENLKETFKNFGKILTGKNSF